ncbi:major facilitator superfamily domain-containing protein [Ditylenchus destructor]|uniref:Major facilitator superfamily domain-containing protein n=1 Tax=Ditylenchus destructor TaxID=166010 RepID=A0AAD4MTV1_9BILA|nr:major facilitator superfamily domain-containing protein [Ditylenchus destructor]
MGYPFLFTLRVLQGSGSSPSLMMINSVTDQWSPIATAGTFLIMLSTYCQFGPILTMPAAAGLCESRWGWPMVYYLQGTLTLVLLLIFFAFFRVSPREHPLVEQQGMVWICWLGFFGDELGYQIFQQYGPIFLNKALGMNVRDTGIAAALPFIVAIVTKLIAGPISDRMTCVSDRARINIFSIVSQVGTIVCYACLAVIPKLAPNSPIWLMQIFYTSINIFSG